MTLVGAVRGLLWTLLFLVVAFGLTLGLLTLAYLVIAIQHSGNPGKYAAAGGLAGFESSLDFISMMGFIMAAIVGSIIFVVVVVGGLGSLAGAFVGSLVIGLLQTLPLTVDKSFADLAARWGWQIAQGDWLYSIAKITLAQAAPILPYLLLVLILIFRPMGLLGTRDT